MVSQPVGRPGPVRTRGAPCALAFLAVEGAFMLRYFRLMDIGQDEWDSMLDDVRALLLTAAGASGD